MSTVPFDAVLVGASLLGLVGLLAGVSWLARRQRLEPEPARKLIHVGLGLYCMSWPLLFDQVWPVLWMCGLAVVLLLGVRGVHARGEGGIGAGLHGVARTSYGEVLFAASVALLFVFGHGQPVLYLVPLAILTLSDAAAALIGARYGRALFRIEEGTKSVEGAVIFFLTAWILTMVLLLAFSEAPRLSVIVLGFLIALYGTLVEASSWRGWDNFFLPMAILLVLKNRMDAPPMVLLEGAGAFAALLLAMVALRRRLGLDAHAAGFMATVVATIAAATTGWNVIVPAMALGCHLLTERLDGSPTDMRHLTLSLVMVLLAFVWYLFGNLTPYPTVAAYNLSFGALGVMLVANRGRVWLALGLVPPFFIAAAARPIWMGDTLMPDTLDLGVLTASAVLPAVVGLGRGLGVGAGLDARLERRLEVRLGAVRYSGMGAVAFVAGMVSFVLSAS